MKQVLLDVIVVLGLVAFAGIGISHIFKPDFPETVGCSQGR
jgi:hypothetical protein